MTLIMLESLPINLGKDVLELYAAMKVTDEYSVQSRRGLCVKTG
jgi:hypothetical protein